MIRNYKRGEWKTDVRYDVDFDCGDGSGFTFPCDAEGNLLPNDNPLAEKNYKWCMAHPEHFKSFNRVIKRVRRYLEPDSGTCVCGEHIEFRNEYHGACECPKCGRWYNLFGQELLPPDQWEKDPSEYDEDY